MKPSRKEPKSPQHLTLDPTVEVEDEDLGEAAEGHVNKKRKAGMSKKFMSMSNLLSGVEAEIKPEESSMEPLQASHRPESPKALEHTVGTVKPTLKKSMSLQQLMVSAACDALGRRR